MVAVQIFLTECFPYILKSSREARHFRIFFNLEIYPKHIPPPMFMILFLERMGVLSATEPHVPPRLSKPILNVLLMYRYIFLGNNFSKQYYALNKIFKLFTYKHFKKKFRKSIIMVKVYYKVNYTKAFYINHILYLNNFQA